MGESRPLRSHTGLICLSAGTPGVGHPVPCSLGFLICEKGATVACAHCGVVGVKPEGACLPSLLSSLYPPPPRPAPHSRLCCLKQWCLDGAGGQATLALGSRTLLCETPPPPPLPPSSARGEGREESGKRESGATSGFGARATGYLVRPSTRMGDKQVGTEEPRLRGE